MGTGYLITTNNRGLQEVTEAEFLSLFGDSTQHPYVTRLYRGDITLADVPEDLQEAVQTIVNNRIARWGLWRNLPASPHEVTALAEAVTTSGLTKGQARDLFTALETLRAGATDNQALEAKYLYPVWKPDTAYTTDHRLLYGDTLYRVLQDHTSQADWTPDITPALYTVVEAVHSGTANDPIPYSGNMVLLEGLYYTQDGVLYHCFRSTGIPVYNALVELVGLYVEIISD